MENDTKGSLYSYQAPVSIKLALIWTSVMFLYIYNDYFSLYLPGTVDGMIAGKMGPLGPASPTTLLAVALMLAVPALMIALSVLLPPKLSRTLNIVFGLLYTVIEALTFIGTAPFYKVLVILEVVLTALVVWYSLRWRRSQPPSQ